MTKKKHTHTLLKNHTTHNQTQPSTQYLFLGKMSMYVCVCVVFLLFTAQKNKCLILIRTVIRILMLSKEQALQENQTQRSRTVTKCIIQGPGQGRGRGQGQSKKHEA